jgi:HemY protein
LARAALAARDFETARDALEPLLVGDPTQRVCELMGALEGAEDHGAAAQVWLSRAIHAPADACWVAEGYQSHIWVPVVPETGAFDALNWQVPAKRDGERAALVPPTPPSPEPQADEDRQQIAPAQAKSEAEAPIETPEKDQEIDHVDTRDTLPEYVVPEHVVVAPDDPGPEGSGFEENSAKGESAKW